MTKDLIPEPVAGLLASEMWHLSVPHKHEPSKFFQCQEVHIRALPWVDERLAFETVLYESWAIQWPQLVLGSVPGKTIRKRHDLHNSYQMISERAVE